MARVHITQAGDVQVQMINASRVPGGPIHATPHYLPANSRMIWGKSLDNWPDQDGQKRKVNKEILMIYQDKHQGKQAYLPGR